MIYTSDDIRELLQSNDKAVIKGLFRMYERQTNDEQIQTTTKHKNRRGFNKPDGHKLADIAQSVDHYGRITTRQLAFVRRRLLKYARQLAILANDNNLPKLRYNSNIQIVQSKH